VTAPPIGTGKFLPLSLELVAGYSFEAAARSRRRAKTSEYAQEKIGRELSDREIRVVDVSRPPTA